MQTGLLKQVVFITAIVCPVRVGQLRDANRIMKINQLMVRPSKFLDASKLERWVPVHILAEWEFSDCAEYIDFWDWLDMEHSDVLGLFESWYHSQHA